MQGNLEKFRVIMDSMTAQEKNEPTILKQERIRRVARGSGVTEKDVRDLITQWNRSRKMMKGIKGNRQLRKQMKQMMSDVDDVDLPM
jgi:signal recognition particle subunit SRP54